MSSKPKRIRAGNFSAEGKEMTLAFVQEHSVVLESKTADPNIFLKKRKLWEELAEKIRKAGHIRSPSKLRDNYFRMKQAALPDSKRNKEKRVVVQAHQRARHPLIWIGQFTMFVPSTLKKTCLRLIRTSLNQTQTRRVKNGFRKAGIHPFNSKVVPDKQFLPEGLKRYNQRKSTVHFKAIRSTFHI
jgi:hypothetical protein